MRIMIDTNVFILMRLSFFFQLSGQTALAALCVLRELRERLANKTCKPPRPPRSSAPSAREFANHAAGFDIILITPPLSKKYSILPKFYLKTLDLEVKFS